MKEFDGFYPIRIRRAVLILWIVLGIGCVGTLTHAALTMSPAELLLVLPIVALDCLFTWFFVYFIRKRRHWARVLLLVLTVISLIYYIWKLTHTFPIWSAPGLLVGFANCCLTGVALYYLFMDRGDNWFPQQPS